MFITYTIPKKKKRFITEPLCCTLDTANQLHLNKIQFFLYIIIHTIYNMYTLICIPYVYV